MKLIKWKIRWRREKEDRGNCVPSEMLHKPRAWNEELSTQDPPTTSSITQPIYWGCPTCNPSTAAAAKLLQLCPTLCDPIDSSPPGSPGPGILQPRTLEWVAISFSNAWKWKVKVKSLSRVWLFTTPWTAAYQAPLSMGFSRQEYWSGLPLPSLNPSTTRAQISWDFCECHFWGLTPDLQIQILWKMMLRKWHFNKHPRCFWFIPRFGNSIGCSVKMQRSRWFCIFIYFVGIQFSVRILKTF